MQEQKKRGLKYPIPRRTKGHGCKIDKKGVQKSAAKDRKKIKDEDESHKMSSGLEVEWGVRAVPGVSRVASERERESR
jgi:hypothetical protein